jgi:hypothetical protein
LNSSVNILRDSCMTRMTQLSIQRRSSLNWFSKK